MTPAQPAEAGSVMPEWPKRDDELIERFKEWWCLIDRDFLLEYERARAEAALARLRVAVEALESLRGSWRVGCYVYSDVDGMANEAAEALALIGPLPPRPGNAGEP